MNILVFDIETIPDIELGRKIYGLDSLDDADTLQAMKKLNIQKSGNDFFPLFMHRIVAISLVLKTNSNLNIWSLGNVDCNEQELLQRFFDGIERYTPTIISWNGTNFDLPVIHYRALKYGISGSRYWETGKHDPNFKWNNYLNRYHERHTDIMDSLAGFSPRAITSLENTALLINLPGKMGIDGSKVYDMYNQGNIQDIRDYCEIDVLNTYLIFLKFELIKNNLDNEQYNEKINEAKEFLTNSEQNHFHKYLDTWNSNNNKDQRLSLKKSDKILAQDLERTPP